MLYYFVSEREHTRNHGRIVHDQTFAIAVSNSLQQIRLVQLFRPQFRDMLRLIGEEYRKKCSETATASLSSTKDRHTHFRFMVYFQLVASQAGSFWLYEDNKSN